FGDDFRHRGDIVALLGIGLRRRQIAHDKRLNGRSFILTPRTGGFLRIVARTRHSCSAVACRPTTALSTIGLGATGLGAAELVRQGWARQGWARREYRTSRIIQRYYPSHACDRCLRVRTATIRHRPSPAGPSSRHPRRHTRAGIQRTPAPLLNVFYLG